MTLHELILMFFVGLGIGAGVLLTIRLPLFDPLGGTIHDRFVRFHRDHPQVYAELVRRAREANAVRQRIGIRCIWERMRWYFKIEQDDRERFKLNDHYTSRYARLIDSQEPDLAGFFELRDLRAE